MITGFFHASFTVSDIERSKQFYGDLLGLELVHTVRHDQPYTATQIGFEDAVLEGAAFRVPGVEPQASTHVLELIEYLHPRGGRIEVGTNVVGSAHICLVPDDIHTEYERLAAAGVEFVSPPVEISHGPNRGGFAVYFKDPDGNRLELLQPPARG